MINKLQNVIETNKKTFNKFICDKYFIIQKFVYIDDEHIDRIHNTIQRMKKILRKYYERFNKIFTENDDQNYTIDNVLIDDERILFVIFIKQFINDIRNLKFRQRIYAKYIENLFSNIKNLIEICIFAKKKFNVMQFEKRLKFKILKNKKNERFKILKLYFEQLNSINYSIKAKTTKIVQNVLIDRKFFIDVMYNNNRRSQRQSIKISNNERIQNVNSIDYTMFFTSNISKFQQYSKYSFQNFRNQQQIIIYFFRNEI